MASSSDENEGTNCEFEVGRVDVVRPVGGRWIREVFLVLGNFCIRNFREDWQ
jgi:hypothetical protein